MCNWMVSEDFPADRDTQEVLKVLDKFWIGSGLVPSVLDQFWIINETAAAIGRSEPRGRALSSIPGSVWCCGKAL